jgi:hypothetical protein
VIEITNNDVPPDKMLAGVNVLVMPGGVVVTESVSVAVHAPDPAHDKLVLLTLVGGVIEAVLVTAVCACTSVTNKADDNKKASTTPPARMERPIARHNRERSTTRLTALEPIKIIPYASIEKFTRINFN